MEQKKLVIYPNKFDEVGIHHFLAKSQVPSEG